MSIMIQYCYILHHSLNYDRFYIFCEDARVLTFACIIEVDVLEFGKEWVYLFADFIKAFLKY